jgi:hypothetical protein
MAALQAALSRRAGGRGGMAALLLAALAAGCATTEEFFAKAKAPEGAGVGQVVCMWENAVRFVPDPARQGEPNAGLAGRMYLFDQALEHLLEGDGSVNVFLYDETNGPPVMQEVWAFDAEALKRLMRKDRYGAGYTLFLPWGKYHPDVTKVRLRVQYQPAKGTPQYTESALTLAPTNGVIRQGQGGGPVTLTGGQKGK